MYISVAFSIHRPEIIPLAEPHMRRHDAICLEEPKTPGFTDMLEGRLGIDDYLMATDFEFPAYERRNLALMRNLYAEGKAILQLDPYMDVLAEIHELFADGGSPDDIPKNTLQHEVYRRERLWSGALLDFYRRSTGTDFGELVEAVKFFGRADASRGRLRDSLRAQRIADIAGQFDSVYVETGYIHAYLLTALRKFLPDKAQVEPLYLLEPIVRRLTGKRQELGPGDVLTLTYTYKPEYTGSKADLQAARSIIRTKILRKNEITASLDLFPHTQDEIEASRLVRQLSFEDCRQLFPRIRSKRTAEARKIVTEFVDT